MDQDITFQINHKAMSAAAYSYIFAPYRCTVRNVIATTQADPGDSKAITVTTWNASSAFSTTIGTYTYAASLATPALGTWAANASTGNTVIEADKPLRFATASCASSCNIHISVELDPYART